MDGFYRPVDPDTCQGDVIDGIPHLFLRPPLYALRRVMLSGGRESLGFYEYPTPPGGKEPKGGPFHFVDGEDTLARCHLARAVVLNHDCDVENDHEHRLVALVRPLPASIPPEHAEVIRRNGNFSYFHLPATVGLPESYVDFRRITSLHPEFLSRGTRLVSLTPEAVKALRLHLLRFFTHADVQP